MRCGCVSEVKSALCGCDGLFCSRDFIGVAGEYIAVGESFTLRFN